MNDLKIGVVGTGGWGKNHLRVLNELNVLHCLCDVDPERASFWSKKYRCKAYTDFEKMLSEEALDAVNVCTPTSTHFDIASKALKRGVNTFVEKPMTSSASQGKQLLELAKDSKVLLTVGFIERFNPAVSEAKSAIKNKMLGDPLLLEFHRENKWAGRVTDVGVVSDTSVHDIDTARWLFDEEPFLVFARVGNVLAGSREDFAVITLGFKKEKSAFIMSNWVTPKRLRQMTVVCTQGVITLDFISQESRYDDASGTRIPRREYREPLLIELEHFVECVKSGKDPLVKPKDGLNNTIIAEAALASSSSGTPIYLDL